MTRRPAAVVLVALVALAGCQAPTPTEPPPTRTTSAAAPSPTPSPSCTPEAGGASYPCTAAQYAAMKEKDALYAEAEAVYSRMFQENIRISRAGGVNAATAVMTETTAGRALESVIAVFRSLKERGLRAQGEDPRMTVQRLPGLAKEGTEVTLLVCVDASRWAFYKGKELVSKGASAEDRIYFGHSGGALKMLYVEGRRVESCD